MAKDTAMKEYGALKSLLIRALSFAPDFIGTGRLALADGGIRNKSNTHHLNLAL
jgi:hypothetical protein